MTSIPGSTNLATLSGTLDANLPITELRLPDGRIVRMETIFLLGDSPLELAPEPSLLREGEAQVIPIIEEKLIVGKQTVETGKVRLIKTVSEYQEQLNEPLAVRTFDVERVLLNQPVDTAPAMRQEGSTTIYPIVEEQLMLTKRLILKEELRVTLRETERLDTQVVTLRREHLTVEREDLDRRERN